MKSRDWKKAKKKLIKIYQEKGILTCESCGGIWGLSFHHLDRRSGLKAENTFEGTRLLCIDCHHKADNAQGHKEFNERLKELR